MAGVKRTKVSIYRRRGSDVTAQELRAMRDGCRAVTDMLFPGQAFALSVTVCGQEEIRRVNAEEREVDAVTDVLSFPMLSLTPGEDPADAAGDCDMEDGRIYLGDMLLCAPRARQQAGQYGHSLRREFAFLCAHSVLHMLGYDHMTEGERRQMEALQKRALIAAGYPRTEE